MKSIRWTTGKLAKDTLFKFWTPRYCPLKISERRYNLSEGDLEGQYNFTNAYYVVKAKFTNINNQEGEEQGISLLSIPLVGKNYMVVFNAIAYPHLNQLCLLVEDSLFVLVQI